MASRAGRMGQEEEEHRKAFLALAVRALGSDKLGRRMVEQAVMGTVVLQHERRACSRFKREELGLVLGRSRKVTSRRAGRVANVVGTPAVLTSLLKWQERDTWEMPGLKEEELREDGLRSYWAKSVGDLSGEQCIVTVLLALDSLNLTRQLDRIKAKVGESEWSEFLSTQGTGIEADSSYRRASTLAWLDMDTPTLWSLAFSKSPGLRRLKEAKARTLGFLSTYS